MFIKQLDFLSPPITFYYNKKLSHTSVLSGILSIFSILILLGFVLYFASDILDMKNPKAFYYNTFIDDAGSFPINASSLFHFISMSENDRDPTDTGVNFTHFRVIGLNTHFYKYYIAGDIKLFDHWLYGFCNNESDTFGISHLITKSYFKNSACIRKYFSSSDQKYYDTGDSKFVWPKMAHGTFNENIEFYSIIIEKCREDTINLILGEGYNCSNALEMDEAVSHHGIVHFNFINNYVNILNYKEPIRKYFYEVENSLEKEKFVINHINFNPSLIKTNNGLIFDNFQKQMSYAYERDDVFSNDFSEDQAYMAYYLWLNNNVLYYERIYKKIQDVISNIGGISQAINFVAYFFNYLYNNYIILFDTQLLLSKLISSEKSIHKIKNIKINHLKDKSRKYQNELEKNTSINNLKRSSDREQAYNEKSNTNINSIKEKENFKSKCNTDTENANNKHKIKYNINNGLNEKIHNIQDDNKKPKNFWSFLLYKISCGKKHNSFQIYEDFRISIISEEHLVKNHLYIYNLLKINKRKMKYFRDSYHLKDLIKFI